MQQLAWVSQYFHHQAHLHFNSVSFSSDCVISNQPTQPRCQTSTNSSYQWVHWATCWLQTQHHQLLHLWMMPLNHLNWISLSTVHKAKWDMFSVDYNISIKQTLFLWLLVKMETILMLLLTMGMIPLHAFSWPKENLASPKRQPFHKILIFKMLLRGMRSKDLIMLF